MPEHELAAGEALITKELGESDVAHLTVPPPLWTGPPQGLGFMADRGRPPVVIVQWCPERVGQYIETLTRSAALELVQAVGLLSRLASRTWDMAVALDLTADMDRCHEAAEGLLYDQNPRLLRAISEWQMWAIENPMVGG